MKSILLSLTLLAGIIIPIKTGVLLASTNLVPNSSLETSIVGNEPDSWYPDYWGNLNAVFTYPAVGYTGKGVSVTVTKRKSGDAKWFFEPQAVTPGHTYTFSNYYKSTVASVVTAQFTSTSGVTTYKDLGKPASSANWKKFTGTVIVPANTSKLSIFHRLTANGTLMVDDYTLTDNADTGGNNTYTFNASCNANATSAFIGDTVLWTAQTNASGTPSFTWTGDESLSGSTNSTAKIYTTAGTKKANLTIVSQGVSKTANCSITINSKVQPPFTPTIVSDNLISNPSLEINTSGKPAGWITDSWGNNNPTFKYPVTGHTGNGASVTTSSFTDGDAKWVFEAIPVKANTDYLYTDWYKSTTKSVVIAQFTLKDGSRRYIILSVEPSVNGWTKTEKTFNTPTDTVSVSILHVIAGVGTLTIDDVSLNELASGTFNKGMVTLSFDDNDLSFYQAALPLLKSTGIGAAQNVPTDFIGQSDKMTAAQLAEIKSAGFEIDSHSVSHPFLTTLSDAEAIHETADSRTILKSLSLTPVTTFAYPYGDYDDRIEAIVRNAGYSAGRGTIPGFNTKNTDLYALHTQNVELDTSLTQIKQWVDDAIAHKTWLILGLHEINDVNDTYSIPASTFSNILAYIKSKNISVVTMAEGINAMR